MSLLSKSSAYLAHVAYRKCGISGATSQFTYLTLSLIIWEMGYGYLRAMAVPSGLWNFAIKLITLVIKSYTHCFISSK